MFMYSLRKRLGPTKGYKKEKDAESYSTEYCSKNCEGIYSVT